MLSAAIWFTLLLVGFLAVSMVFSSRVGPETILGLVGLLTLMFQLRAGVEDRNR